MQFRFQKIFRNEQDEILWLNKMASDGLLLSKRAPMTYFFNFNEGENEKYYYKIVYMHDAVENGASDDELEKLPMDGSFLACGYKNRAYLLKAEDSDFADYDDFSARYKHFISIWSFYLFSFLATLGVFAYHFDYAIKMLIEDNPIPSIGVVSISAAALILSGILFSHYLDEALIWKRKLKDLKTKSL